MGRAGRGLIGRRKRRKGPSGEGDVLQRRPIYPRPPPASGGSAADPGCTHPPPPDPPPWHLCLARLWKGGFEYVGEELRKVHKCLLTPLVDANKVSHLGASASPVHHD